MDTEVNNGTWHEARKAFLPFEGVIGVGWGPKLRAGEVVERHAIVVLVEKKLPAASVPDGQAIPAEFHGVPTDVRVPRLSPAAEHEHAGVGGPPAETCLPDALWIEWPKIHRRRLEQQEALAAQAERRR